MLQDEYCAVDVIELRPFVSVSKFSLVAEKYVCLGASSESFIAKSKDVLQIIHSSR